MNRRAARRRSAGPDADRPSAPGIADVIFRREQLRAGSTAGANRECQVANSVRCAARAAVRSGVISATVAPGGFSSITCLPAASAIAACA